MWAIIIFISVGCSRNKNEISRADGKISVMSSTPSQEDNKIKSFISSAIRDSNPKRLDYFSSLISDNNPSFVKADIKEGVVRLIQTGDTSICYYSTRLSVNLKDSVYKSLADSLTSHNIETLGGYIHEGYILMLDGCYHYGTYVVTDTGESYFWEINQTTSYGFAPICPPEIDMDALAFNNSQNKYRHALQIIHHSRFMVPGAARQGHATAESQLL